MDEDNNNEATNNDANAAGGDSTAAAAAAAAAADTNVEQQQAQSEREQVLEQYRAKIREHREVEARLKRMREDVKGLQGRYQKTEDDLTALQSVGQIIGDWSVSMPNASLSRHPVDPDTLWDVDRNWITKNWNQELA